MLWPTRKLLVRYYDLNLGLFSQWQQFFRGNFDGWNWTIPEFRTLYNSFAQRVGRRGFPAYVEVVKNLPDKKEFTPPFDLREAAQAQNKLSTWIEHLCFVRYFYNEYACTVTYQQSTFDKAWKKLELSVNLKPFGTQEYHSSVES
ncbi:hypothetical protein F5Y12DRAFT_342233 [Xylaria sp. FL1777]|nr:hypothetical protein F5Y12DRAFT_342233 [Xylaria sp. FL1777]